MMTLKVLGTEAAPSAGTVDDARLVRLVNTGSDQTITIAGTTTVTFTMLANTVELVEKEPSATVTAGAGVSAVSVAFR